MKKKIKKGTIAFFLKSYYLIWLQGYRARILYALLYFQVSKSVRPSTVLEQDIDTTWKQS